MDINIEIKEEDPLSDNNIASKNEQAVFNKDVPMKTNSNAVFLDVDSDLAVKTEIKSETPFPDFCSQKEREFLKEESATKVKKDNRYYEMDNQMEIKVEPWWLDTETSSVCDDIKDGDFTAVKSPRLCTETVSGDSSGSSQLLSAEASMENLKFYYGKDCHECRSPESDVTKISRLEKHVHPERSGKCSVGEMYSSTLLIDKEEKSQKFSILNQSIVPSSPSENNDCKKPHKCQICNKRFTRLSNLKVHNLIHEGKQPHKCEICEKRFTRLSHLKLHSLIHEGKKPHICEICEKSFTRLSDLRMHNLIHEGKKPHRCVVCEKSFTHVLSLKLHNMTHEGKKPHKCVICEKGFTQLSDLKRHSLIHEVKKPRKCMRKGLLSC